MNSTLNVFYYYVDQFNNSFRLIENITKCTWKRVPTVKPCTAKRRVK